MADSSELQFKILAQVIGAQSIDKLKNSVDSVATSAKSSQSILSGIATAAKGLAAAFALREVTSFAMNIFEAGEQLNKLAQKTGISARELSGFKAAAELADLPLEKLTVGLKKLAVSQVDASAGNSSIIETFKRLGVAYKDSDGKIRDTALVVRDIADAFQKTKDGPQKAADAVKLFGKAGTDMIPFLNQGSASLSEFGLNIDSTFAKGSEAFLDNIKRMKIATQNFALEGLKPLLPTLVELTNAYLKTSADSSALAISFEIIGETVRILAVGFNDFVTILINGIDVAITGLKELYNGFRISFSSIGDLIRDGSELVDAFLHGSKSDFFDAGKKLGKDVVKGVKEVFAENDKVVADLVNRVNTRGDSASKFRNEALKNSLLLGQGTISEVIARRQKEQEELFKDSNKSNPAQSQNEAIKEFENKIKRIQAEAKTLNISNVAKEKAIFLAEVEAKEIEKGSAAYNKLAAEVEKALKAREFAKETQAIRDFNIAQKKSIELSKLEIDQLNYSSVEYKKLVEIKKSDAQVAEATKNYTKEGAKAYRDAAGAILEQKLALIDMQQQQKESFGYGAREAIRDYVESAKDAAQQMRQVFTHAFSQLEDTMVNFIKTGKLNFRNFANAVIDDLLRIAVRQAIVGAIVGLGFSAAGAGASTGGATAGSSLSPGTLQSGFANGGVMSSSGSLPLNKYANGGIAKSPQVALFGEGRMNEAYVPLPDGRSIPVSMKGGGQGGSTNIVVNVNMTTGEQSASGSSDNAKQLGKTISQLVQSELINQKRPGGLLS